MSRFIKISLLIISSLFAIIATLLIALQLGLFNNFIKNMIIDSANKSLNASVVISHIEGNPLNSLEISGIQLLSENEELISLKKVSYEVSLSQLLSKTIFIDKIAIDGLLVNLTQIENGWNLAQIVKEKEEVSPKQNKESKPAKINLILKDFSLLNSNINLIFENSRKIQQIKNINFSTFAKIDNEKINFKLSNFNLDYNNSKIEKFDIDLMKQNDQVSLEKFVLETSKNRLSLVGEANINEKSGELTLNLPNLEFSEFRDLIPNFNVFGNPEINLKAKTDGHKVQANLSINENLQNLNIEVEAENIYEIPKFKISSNLDKIDISHWLQIDKLNSAINSNIEIEGSGKNPENIEAIANFKIYDSTFDKKKIEDLNLFLEKKNDSAALSLNTITDFAKVKLIASGSNIFVDPNFEISTEVKQFDASPFSKDIHTNLNFKSKISGSLKSKIIGDLQLGKSEVNEIEINTIDTNFSFANNVFNLNNLNVFTDFLELKADGSSVIEGNNNFNFELKFLDLNKIKKLVNAENLNVEGKIRGNAKGTIDNLDLNSNIELNNIIFNEIKVDSLNTIVSANSESKSGTIETKITNVNIPDFVIEEINLASDFSEKYSMANLNVQANDSLKLNTNVEFIGKNIKIPKLDILFNNERWKTSSDSLEISLENEKINVSKFLLESKEQKIYAHGLIDLNNKSDFTLKINDLDISTLNTYSPVNIKGLFNTDINFKGSVTNPNLKSSVSIDSAKVDEIDFNSFVLNTNLEDKNLELNFKLNKTIQDSIFGSSTIPLKLENDKLTIAQNEKFTVKLESEGIDLSFVKELVPQVSNFAGKFNTEIDISNTISNPIINARVAIDSGKVIVDEFGVDYNYDFLLATKNGEIDLQKLLIKSRKGNLEASGKINFSDQLFTQLKDFEFSIAANDFEAAYNKNIQVLLNSDFQVNGDLTHPKFAGNLTLLRTMINVDAFKNSQPTYDTSTPLLVQALQDTSQVEIAKKDKKRTKEIDVVNNLRGDFSFHIPKNTWVKGKDMNIEISGDVQVRKESNDFELYGVVNVLRGNYSIYGRKFDLKDGSITLTGGSEINALLDLKLSYTFRDINKDKKTLLITLTDKAKSPKISFFLDSETIEEKDAISYLLFGKSTQSNSMEDNSEMEEKTSAMGTATNILAKQLSGKVTQSIGEALNLDVIEVSGSEDWKQANITVGKYITNDLFISYQKEFNISSANELTTEEMTLEYELYKNIILQAKQGDKASSGFDLFFKFKK